MRTRDRDRMAIRVQISEDTYAKMTLPNRMM